MSTCVRVYLFLSVVIEQIINFMKLKYANWFNGNVKKMPMFKMYSQISDKII
jgi:hypothetical protein